MTPNIFSVDLFVSKGADGSLLLDIHRDDNGWYNPESKPALPVLPLSRERFPEFCSWLARQLEEKGGGALQLARLSVKDNPDLILTPMITPDPSAVPQEELDRLQRDEELRKYARAGWNWSVMADISSLARLGELPMSYRQDLHRIQNQLQLVSVCLKARLESC